MVRATLLAALPVLPLPTAKTILPHQCGHYRVVVRVGNMVNPEVEGIQLGAVEDIIDANAEVALDVGVSCLKERGGEEGVSESASDVSVGVRDGHVVEIAADDDRIG